MYKKGLTKLVLVAIIMLPFYLAGCSMQQHQNYGPGKASGYGELTPENTKVIARQEIKVNISTSSSGSKQLSLLSSSEVIIDVPTSNIMNLQSTISAPAITIADLQTNNWLNLNGLLSFEIFYNGVLDGQEVYLRAYIDSAEGLPGVAKATVELPLKILGADDDVIFQLASTPSNLKLWSDMTTAIDENSLTYSLAINPYRAPAQPYSGTLIFELVKVTP